MSDSENTNFVDPNTDNLGDFEKLLNGTAQPKPQDSSESAPLDESVPVDAEDTSTDVDDPVATEDDLPEEEHEDNKPRLGGKKKSFQERINELTAKAREAERREAAAILRAEQAEASKTNTEPKATTPATDKSAPNPDALNEDGTPKYPFGEVDPQFNVDLLKFENEKFWEDKQNEEKVRRETAIREQAQADLVNDWETKLVEAEKEMPEIRANGEKLTTTFTGLDPQFGEYLATTIMSLDNGPAVLNYLATNLDEARGIVALGPVGATIALGILEGQFRRSGNNAEQPRQVKLTDAPEPPPQATRGNSGKFVPPVDTNDLAAFERTYMTKKK